MEQENITPNQFDAPASAPQPESTPPTSQDKPNHDAPSKPKALIATAIICAILAVASIAFGIYGMFFQPQPKCETNCNQTSDNDGSDIEQAETTTLEEKSDADVRALIDQLYDTLSTNNGPYNKIYDEILFIKADGIKTLIPAQKTYGIYSTRKEYDEASFDSEESLKTLNMALEQLGFTKNTEIESSPLLNGLNDYINTDKNIACATSPMKIVCAHTSWVDNEAIALANELSEAYYAKTNAYPYSINTSLNTTKDSKIVSYQTLSIPIGNAMGLFYRTSPEEKWQYFISTQMELACQKYDTIDLKNAFAGEQCYDEETGAQSTVQP